MISAYISNLVRHTFKTSKTGKLRIFTNLKNRLLKFVKIREFLNFFKIRKMRILDLWCTEWRLQGALEIKGVFPEF